MPNFRFNVLEAIRELFGFPFFAIATFRLSSILFTRSLLILVLNLADAADALGILS
jgi:hypothetical protein